MKTRRVQSTDKVGGFLRWAGVTVFCGALLLGTARRAMGATVVVDTTSDVVDGTTTDIPTLNANKGADGKISLREAITAANNTAGANTIDCSGISGTITLTSGPLSIATAGTLSITGPGASKLTIDGNNASRVFYNGTIGATVTISGLTVTNGYMVGTDAVTGGGIYARSFTSLILDGVTVTGCKTKSTAFLSNTAAPGGGGVAAFGTLTLRNGCVVSGNSCVAGSAQYGNAFGGGVFFRSSSDTLTIKYSTISNNSLSAVAGTTYNKSYGGGVYCNGSVVIQNSTISNNTGTATAAGTGALALGMGASFFGGHNAQIQNSTISGNIANIAGPGTGQVYGAGIGTRNSTTSLQNSTVSGNTFSNSAATARGFGGGIWGLSTINLLNCSIISNAVQGSGDKGGGVYTLGGTLSLTSTIVAKNTRNSGATPDDIFSNGSAVSGSYSLLGDGTGQSGITDGNNHNKVGVDPLVGPLRNNNGPTQTHALLAGSPAINAGLNTTDIINPGNLSRDQRGTAFLRDDGNGVDIGAFERQTPSTKTVTDPGDIGLTNDLRHILGRTSDGDTVNFALPAGTTITLNGTQLNIVASVSITGPGAANLTVDGNNASRLFYVSAPASAPNVTISGLKLARGKNTTGYGGGIVTAAVTNLTLDAVTVTGCVNSRTGPNTGATVFAKGGAIYAAGALTLQNGCVISGNAVKGITPGSDYTKPCGGGIFAANATTIKDSTISGNTCTASGVASATLFNEARGGGIYSNNQISIQNSTISGNTVSVPAGPSKAYIYGAGLVVYAKGAGPSTIQNCTISGNSATAASTGPYFSGGRGGAMYVSFFSTQPLSLQNCTISGNTISSSSAGGTQRSYGGAIDIGASQPLYLNNCTVAYNDAKNSSGLAGGIYVNGSSTVTLTSTIVAKNTHNSGAVSDDLIGSTFTGTYNLIGNGSGSNLTNGGSNQVGSSGSPIDPKLEPLHVNHGTTATHALQSSSPAINAGPTTAPTDIILGGTLATDQRGFARKTGANVDIGAFEFQPASGKIVTDPADPGGPNSLRTILNGINEGDTITFNLPAGTTITLNGTQLSVIESVSITGPGASNLTIDGNNLSRVFNLDPGNTGSVSISGLTIAHGKLTSTYGGAGVYARSGGLTLDSVNVNACSLSGVSAGDGAGVLVYFGISSLTTINNCVISGNTISSSGGAQGGGIFAGAPLKLTNSTVTGNQLIIAAAGGNPYGNGGGLFSYAAKIQNCTFDNNTVSVTGGTNSYAHGGGIYADNSTGTFSIQNSTISNNTVSGSGTVRKNYGGGLIIASTGQAVIQNCTVANNDATPGPTGGGVHIIPGNSQTTIISSIIAKNTINNGATPYDGKGPLQNGSTNNLIGAQPAGPTAGLTNGGATITNGQLASLVGSTATPLDPKIGALQNNGGPTQTHELLAGSPAINAGLNTTDILGALPLAFDQRGPGFNRQVGAAVDIGSTEREDITPPTAAIGSAPTVTAVDITYAFTIVFSDNKAIDISTLGNGNIKVTGPNGFSQFATFVSASPNTSTTPVTATYRITPPSGAWSTPANGTYTIALQAGQVADTFGNIASAATLGSFSVSVDTVAPTAAIGSAPNVTAAATQYTFTVVFSDNVAIDPSTVSSNGNLLVTGPNGFSQLAKFVSATSNTPTATITGTYSITPPGGAWSPAANGTYSIALLAHKTADTSGNFVAAGTLGTLSVAVSSTPATLSLTSGPTATPSSAGIGQSIQFSAGASLAGTTFSWDFGDGSTDTGANVSHAFTSAGTFTVTVTATNGTQSVTGTVIVTISAPAFGSGPDSNGDGFSDAFDTAFGLNPADPTQSPVPAGTPAGTLTAAKLKVTLSFGKPNNDSLSLSGTLPIPAGFKINGARIGLSAGDVVEVVTLGTNGKGKVGGNTASVSIKSTKGTVAAQSAKYSITLKKDSLAADLLSSGLVNDNVKNKSVTISVGVVLSQADRSAGVVEEGTLTLHYTATKGKVGSAK